MKDEQWLTANSKRYQDTWLKQKSQKMKTNQQNLSLKMMPPKRSMYILYQWDAYIINNFYLHLWHPVHSSLPLTHTRVRTHICSYAYKKCEIKDNTLKQGMHAFWRTKVKHMLSTAVTNRQQSVPTKIENPTFFNRIFLFNLRLHLYLVSVPKSLQIFVIV